VCTLRASLLIDIREPCILQVRDDNQFTGPTSTAYEFMFTTRVGFTNHFLTKKSSINQTLLWFIRDLIDAERACQSCKLFLLLSQINTQKYHNLKIKSYLTYFLHYVIFVLAMHHRKINTLTCNSNRSTICE
jgi:hypothetical protein